MAIALSGSPWLLWSSLQMIPVQNKISRTQHPIYSTAMPKSVSPRLGTTVPIYYLCISPALTYFCSAIVRDRERAGNPVTLNAKPSLAMFSYSVLVLLPYTASFPCKLQWSLALSDSKPYHNKQLHHWQRHMVCLPVGRIKMGMAIFFAKSYVCKSGYQIVSVPHLHLTAMPKGPFRSQRGLSKSGCRNKRCWTPFKDRVCAPMARTQLASLCISGRSHHRDHSTLMHHPSPFSQFPCTSCLLE